LGRVYDAKIKRIGNAILDAYPGQLSADFRSNKEFLSKILDTKSKFIVNKVTGYVTSQVKRQVAESQPEEEPEVESNETEEAA
jgi:small subunit ribosomal protein S17e